MNIKLKLVCCLKAGLRNSIQVCHFLSRPGDFPIASPQHKRQLFTCIQTITHSGCREEASAFFTNSTYIAASRILNWPPLDWQFTALSTMLHCTDMDVWQVKNLTERGSLHGWVTCRTSTVWLAWLKLSQSTGSVGGCNMRLLSSKSWANSNVLSSQSPVFTGYPHVNKQHLLVIDSKQPKQDHIILP